MEARQHCPSCGAARTGGGPAGLCPSCLLALGLDEGAVAGGVPENVAHYRILRKLGQGGMGEVWLALDTRLDRKVALKVLPIRMQDDPEARQRFIAEAKAAAALDHPYICHIHAVDSDLGLDYIAMEYVEGTTLAERLDAGPVPVDEAVRLGREIAEALEIAHEKQIVHRDLKPANFMLTGQGHVKVMDFGLAKRLGPALPGATAATDSLTAAGRILGTVAWMSPEQIRGEPVSTASDLFSFGVVLHQMLAGVHPFSRGSMLETAHAVLNDGPPKLPPSVPAPLSTLVLRLLARRADERGSIHETRASLAALAEGRSSVPTREPLPLGVLAASAGWLVGLVAAAWTGHTVTAFAVAAGLLATWGLHRFVPAGARRLAVGVLLIAAVGTVLALERAAGSVRSVPPDDREVYVVLAFDRWGVAGDERLLLEVSKKLRSRLEEILAGLPATEVVVRPEFFDDASVGLWSWDRSPRDVLRRIRETDPPADLVLRNRLEQPAAGALLLLTSLQRVQGDALVGTGSFVRAEGAESELLYLTLRVAFGVWRELEREGSATFDERDRRQVRRRVLTLYLELLPRYDEGAVTDAVKAALETETLSDDDVQVLLDAHGASLDASELAERIAARRRSNLEKLGWSR